MFLGMLPGMLACWNSADSQWIERIYLLLLSSFVGIWVLRLRVAEFQINGRVAELVEGT